MKRYWRISFASFCSLLLIVVAAFAGPTRQHPRISEPEVEADLVGDVDGTNPAPQKALQDTIWIADWTFDVGGICSETGWTHVDNYIQNDGVVWWHLETGYYTGTGMCCSDPEGYDNDWYQGIRMTYTGAVGISMTKKLVVMK